MSDDKQPHHTLGTMLAATRDTEIDCDQFHAHLAAWVDSEAASGGPAQHGGAAVDADLHALLEHHRKICPECDEERRVLIRALGLSTD